MHVEQDGVKTLPRFLLIWAEFLVALGERDIQKFALPVQSDTRPASGNTHTHTTVKVLTFSAPLRNSSARFVNCFGRNNPLSPSDGLFRFCHLSRRCRLSARDSHFVRRQPDVALVHSTVVLVLVSDEPSFS